jgi:hypothetical protein
VIQPFTIHLLLNFMVFLGLFFIVWGWRLRSRRLSMASSSQGRRRRTPLASTPRGHGPRFLREMSTRFLAVLKRACGLEREAVSSAAPGGLIPASINENLDKTGDHGGCVGPHGPALPPRAPLTFHTYLERHRSRFNILYR